MPHGREIGLGPKDIVLDGDPAPKKGADPPTIFGPCLLWPNGWIEQDGTWRGGRPQHRLLCVRWGPSPPTRKGAEPPKFSAHVCCGQTAEWIKMALGVEVGLNPGDFVIDGDIAPSPIVGKFLLWPNGWMHHDTTWYGGRHSPPFLANVRCGQTTGCTKMALGMEVGLGPGDFVFDGDPATPRTEGTPTPIQVLVHVYCGQTAGWMKTPLGTEVDLGTATLY